MQRANGIVQRSKTGVGRHEEFEQVLAIVAAGPRERINAMQVAFRNDSACKSCACHGEIWNAPKAFPLCKQRQSKSLEALKFSMKTEQTSGVCGFP